MLLSPSRLLAIGMTTLLMLPGTAAVHAAYPTIAKTPSVSSRVGMQPAGVGHGGQLLEPPGTSTLTYQCPHTDCNQGLVTGGNDVAVICYVQYNDDFWYLTLDHNNNVAGFLPVAEIQPSVAPDLCPHNEGSTLSAGVIVRQCPEYFCNVGNFSAGDHYETYCFVSVDSGVWLLSLDTDSWIIGFFPVDNGAAWSVC